MKPRGTLFLQFCAVAILAIQMPCAGASGQDGEPVTRVVPAESPSPSPIPSSPAAPESMLPPIGSGPDDATPAPPPAFRGATPAESSPTPTPAAAATAPVLTPAPAPAPTPSSNANAPIAAATPTPVPAPPSPYSIEIDLGAQRAYLLKSGHIVAASPISSGRPDHITATGNFQVIQKDLDHFSNLYGMFVNKDTGRVVLAGADAAMPVPKGCEFVPAPMKWFMRFDGAAGMHAGILPGYAASHGCVRMPASKAELFFETVDVGTPVHVFGTAPPRPIVTVRRIAASNPKPTPKSVPKQKFLWWL